MSTLKLTLEHLRRDLLSSKQAVQYLPYSQTHLMDLARRGQIPHVRLRGKVFFRKTEIESILRQGLEKATPMIKEQQ